MEIQLIDIDPNTRRVRLRLQPKILTGVLKLTQIVLLSLLNIPGRDILDPEDGGGLPELVGFNFDPDDITEVRGEIVRRIRKTEAEVLAKQVGLTIPPEERLREVQIRSITPGEAIDEVLVRVRVVNELGQQLDAVV